MIIRIVVRREAAPLRHGVRALANAKGPIMNPPQRILSPTPTPEPPVSGDVSEHKSLSAVDLRNQPPSTGASEISPRGDKTRQNSAESSGAGNDTINSTTTPLPGRGRPRKGLERLIWELAIGATLNGAAKKAGVSKRTAQRRWRDANFVLEVFAVRRQFRSSSAGRICALTRDAVEVLRAALTTDVPTSRISAARAILRFDEIFGMKGEELALLQQQLEQVATGDDGDAGQAAPDESY
jgi:hypothetical protein